LVQAVFAPRGSRQSVSTQRVRLAALRRWVFDPIWFVRVSIGESPAWMQRLLVACVVALLLTLGITSYQSQSRVIGGVQVAGVSLGGMTYADARARLDERAREFNEQQVTLSLRGKTWQPTLTDLGVTLDTEAAWASILGFGSPRYLPHRILRGLNAATGPLSVGTPVLIDRQSLEAYCRDLAADLGIAPVDAQLMVDGESILVTQDKNGYVISVDQLQQDLVRDLNGFTLPTIDLTASVSPATVQAADIQSDVAALDSVLQESLLLYTETDEWRISAEQLAANVKVDASGAKPRVTIDEAAIKGLVDQVAEELDRPVKDGVLDESGLYPRIVKPQEGITVDRDELTKRILAALDGGAVEIEIPLSTTPPGADIGALLKEYGVTDLLAAGSSDFSGSDPGRATNVRRAAELIDGTLVAPGEVFSFNQALGSITEVGGFVPAGATEGGIPGTAVGGGVCQVSTSIFRAALFAGLPITEWYPHAYRSTFYEQGGWAPGFDASIQQPDDDPLNGPDLKFRNSTDRWLLVRVTATSDAELKVSIFGTATGLDVVVSDPVYQSIVPADQTPIEEVDSALPSGTSELWQPARDGATMVVHRTVYAADGSILLDEDFLSTYQPQGPVYRVSSDMAGTVAAGSDW
jgi:vancomycin resistance protein YoaR